MIITLISAEKNLGLLALTDYLLSILGKDNCAVTGSNYLAPDITPVLTFIDKYTKENKSVIVKYVVPKIKFTNQDIVYPKELKDIGDIVVRVPSLLEELKRPVVLDFYKGETNPLADKVRDYYK